MERKRAVSPNGRSSLDSAVEETIGLYRETAAVPLVSWGDISVNNDFVRVRSKWSFVDMDLEKKVYFSATQQADFRHDSGHRLGPFRTVNPATELNDSIVSVTKSRGTRGLRVVLKEVVRNERKLDYIEVWDQSRRLWAYDADQRDKHGRIITKGSLYSVEWSKSESKFLVVAEKKIPKGESYFSKKPWPTGERGTRFRWEDNWGEDQETVISPVIVVFDLPKDPNETEMQTTVVEISGVSLGQAVFTPDDKGIVCIGMVNTPYRLGAFSCNNRLQKLFHFEFAKQVSTEIGDTGMCIYSPRFTGNGQYLLYLQNEINGPHLTASALIKMAWPAKTKQTLVPVPENPRADEFPGLYTKGLIRHCTTSDGSLLYVESQWHSALHILQIDLASAAVTNITEQAIDRGSPQIYSWELLSVNGEFLLTSCSSVIERPNIVVGRRGAGNKMSWSFKRWGDEPRGSPTQNGLRHFQQSKITNYEVELLEFQPDNDANQYFEAIYVHPKIPAPHRLLVNVHGGPHWASNVSYLPMREFLLSSGFSLLLVNYRGSIGFGETNLRALPGRLGDVDVKDVHKAVMQVKSRGYVTHVALLGASHGGFIAAHLLGQYPHIYKVCCLVNPITDLTAFSWTDIPDWLWYEGGCKGPFRHDWLLSSDDLARLRECSPMVHASNITGACCFFIGAMDRRVDKGQGLKLFKYLLARGVDVRCNMYNDTHQLGSVLHRADYCVNTVRWLDQHYASTSKRVEKLGLG